MQDLNRTAGHRGGRGRMLVGWGQTVALIQLLSTMAFPDNGLCSECILLLTWTAKKKKKNYLDSCDSSETQWHLTLECIQKEHWGRGWGVCISRCSESQNVSTIKWCNYEVGWETVGTKTRGCVNALSALVILCIVFAAAGKFKVSTMKSNVPRWNFPSVELEKEENDITFEFLSNLLESLKSEFSSVRFQSVPQFKLQNSFRPLNERKNVATDQDWPKKQNSVRDLKSSWRSRLKEQRASENLPVTAWTPLARGNMSPPLYHCKLQHVLILHLIQHNYRLQLQHKDK